MNIAPFIFLLSGSFILVDAVKDPGFDQRYNRQLNFGKAALTDFTPVYDKRVDMEEIDPGTVVIVTYKGTGPLLALKRIAQQGKNEEIENTDIRLLQAIDFPLIVRMPYFFKHTPTSEPSLVYLYMVTEYINGGTLDYFIDTVRTTLAKAEWQARFYFAQLWVILEYLHNREVAHEDLHSDNVMVDDSGSLKLIDFGRSVRFGINETEKYKSMCHDVKNTLKFLTNMVRVQIKSSELNDLISKLQDLDPSKCKAEKDVPTLNPAMRTHKFFTKVIEMPNVTSIPGSDHTGYESKQDKGKLIWSSKGIDWDKLVQRKIIPPYKPNREDQSHGQIAYQCMME